jgi:hypothetical protein
MSNIIDEDQDDWWEHSTSHGFPCCHNHRNSKQLWGVVYVFWRIAMIAILITALVIFLLECDHFLVIMYMTVWNVLLCLLFALLSFASMCTTRIELGQNILTGHHHGYTQIEKKNAKWTTARRVAHVMRFVHVAAFTYSLNVFLVYAIGSAATNSMDLNTFSILAHYVAPSLMICDLIVSGLLWQKDNYMLMPLYINVYILFYCFHYKFKLGHWEARTPASKSLNCHDAYAYSLANPYDGW